MTPKHAAENRLRHLFAAQVELDDARRSLAQHFPEIAIRVESVAVEVEAAVAKTRDEVAEAEHAEWLEGHR